MLQHLFTVLILWYISIHLMWCNRGCITAHLVAWYLSTHKCYLKQIYLSQYIEVRLYLVLSNQMLQHHSLTIFTQSVFSQFV